MTRLLCLLLLQLVVQMWATSDNNVSVEWTRKKGDENFILNLKSPNLKINTVSIER